MKIPGKIRKKDWISFSSWKNLLNYALKSCLKVLQPKQQRFNLIFLQSYWKLYLIKHDREILWNLSFKTWIISLNCFLHSANLCFKLWKIILDQRSSCLHPTCWPHFKQTSHFVLYFCFSFPEVPRHLFNPLSAPSLSPGVNECNLWFVNWFRLLQSLAKPQIWSYYIV